MKTSRIDGVLVLNVKTPYQMAKNGMNEDATEIICREINFAAEGVAFDIEQLFFNALVEAGNTARQKLGVKETGDSNTEDENENFYRDESPSDSEIEAQAITLETMFKMSTISKMSEMVRLFDGIVNAGLVMAEGEVKLTTTHPIWMKIKREDRARIIFSYIAFFEHPLLSLKDSVPTAPEQ